MVARCVSAHNEFIRHNKEYHMKALLSSFQQYRQPPSQGFLFLRREGREDRGYEVVTVNGVKYLSRLKVWHLQVGGVAEDAHVSLSHPGAPQYDMVIIERLKMF